MQVSSNHDPSSILLIVLTPLTVALSHRRSLSPLLSLSLSFLLQSEHGQCDCMEGWIGEACEQLSCKFDCHHRGECLPRLVVKGSGGGDLLDGGDSLESMESQTLDLPFNGASDDAKEIEGLFDSCFLSC